MWLVFGLLYASRMEFNQDSSLMVLVTWKGLWDLSRPQMVRDFGFISHLKEKCLSTILGYPHSTDSEGRMSSGELSHQLQLLGFPWRSPTWVLTRPLSQGIRAESYLQTLQRWGFGFRTDQEPWNVLHWILASGNSGTLLFRWTWSLHRAQLAAAFVAFHVPHSSRINFSELVVRLLAYAVCGRQAINN